MSTYNITAPTSSHAQDRRFLRWFTAAQLTELRAMRASQDRTSCPSWERVAVEREQGGAK